MPQPLIQKHSSTGTIEYPWSRDVKKALQVFGLLSFRPNQEDAIIATLSGKDVFVLMPTGGGKSLCYQLPSIVPASSGIATSGLTVVVSPLKSLMQDQVKHLLKIGIATLVISSDSTLEQLDFVYQELYDPKLKAKLMYVTPEMMQRSPKFRNLLDFLHRNKRLARFVIDEAHCVSQWGHDFRPDYKELSSLKTNFPGVPIMALTATANSQVKMDIKEVLKIQTCLTFTQSFNRKNLVYEVRPKTKNIDDDIETLIKGRFANRSGIIYCTSRVACEDVAEKLQKRGIKAAFYHAGIETEDRRRIQDDWVDGRVKVIVATVAFGMGIDKSDVRFVIHYSFPQSLEGYYQETGRAGRDGEKSYCFLFYTFGDKKSHDALIEKGEGSQAQKERLRSNVRNVIAYCENKIECRRQQVLQYFGENFNPANCGRTCDNCLAGSAYVSKDITPDCVNLINLLRSMPKNYKITRPQLMDTFRGMKLKKIQTDELDTLALYGSGSSLSKLDVERIYSHLVAKNILSEECKKNLAGYVTPYVKLGPLAMDVCNGRRKVEMNFVIGAERNSIGGMSKAPKERTTAKAGSVSRGGAKVTKKPLARTNQEFVEDADGNENVLSELNAQCFEELKEHRLAVCFFQSPLSCLVVQH
ncbi:P-loop containing nucleoside triphosphate hydrolase protein [Zopfochytrium polystomum]|nr:P-loop containing nucleoside triphosphate hydrolase protein [Zopfochytrium polystomum]